jgi:hypothetical protein
MWPFSYPNAVPCGGCQGSGICWRCKGFGNADQKVGNCITIGVTCNRCKDESGICVGCFGSGWLNVKHPEK